MPRNLLRPDLVGRDAELAALRDALTQTAGGVGGCLVLSGQPGIGKSRLLDAAEATAAELGLAVAVGRATEHDRATPLATLRGALSRCRPYPVNLDALTTVGAGGYWYVDQVGEALEDFTAEHPLVVLLDDAQWTDELSVTALRALVPLLDSVPLRWILARRTGPRDNPAQDLFAALIESGATRVDVGPLDEDAVTAICATMLGATPDQTVLGLAARAEGNPFLLEQLLDTLAVDDHVVVSGGVATVVGDELPSGFLSAVDRRLRGLSPLTRRMLQAGAVLGRPFSLAAAGRLVGVSPPELYVPVEEALQGAVLSEQDSQLVFRHDLLREAVYNNVAGPVRAAMHLEAATVLRDEGRSAMEVADHLLLSGPTSAPDAVAVLRDAAREAQGRAPSAAATYIVRALSLSGEHAPVRAELSADAVGLLAAAGRLVEAREVGEAALRSGLDAANEAAVLLGLAEAVKHAGQNQLAERYAHRALAVDAVPDPIRARLHAIRAHALMYGGDLAVADRAGAAADEVGTACGEHSAAVFGMVARSVVAKTQGRLADALAHARAAVALADRVGGPVRLRHPRIWLGGALAAMDLFDEAMETYAEGQREAAELGSGWSLPLWHFMRASLLSWRGDLDAAVAENEAGLRVAEQLTARQLSLPMTGLLARIALLRGENDLALVHQTRMRALLADGISAAPEDVAWTFALVHAAAGEHAAALEALDGLISAMPERLLLLSHDPGAGPTIVRIALAAGDRARAETVYRAAQHLYDTNPSVASLAAAAAHARGLLLGDEAAFGRAVDGFRRSPRPLARANAFTDAAAGLRTAGQRARARALLAEAADERAAAGLHRPAGRTGRAAQTSVLGGLTRAELNVARLVVRGLSNRKVAAELFLSPHTVDSHLRHIFAKLGLNGRVALTAFMAEHDRHVDIP